MRWIVGPGDGTTVRDVLERAAADDSAVREGRVFLGLRRVRRDDEPVKDGDVVTVATRGQDTDQKAIRILVRRDDLVAADKPAGISTIPDHAGAANALITLVARALDVDVARLHATSRLDRDVSGVVIFALTKLAAERLVRARTEGTYSRRYLAMASRSPAPDRGTWDVPIGRGPDPRLRVVGGRDAVAATTRYAVCAQAGEGRNAATLLAVSPITGRTHQIRVHAAHAGAPLIGDRTYGGPARVTLGTGRVLEPRRIALHAAAVSVPDGRGGSLDAISPIPTELEDLWLALGGDPSAWDVATSCALS